MTVMQTPGLYRQTVQPAPNPGPLVRGDVTVIPGYATKGPAYVPVRVQSIKTFQDVFGGPVAHGYLWHAAKAFFECGGATLNVIRVTDDTATAARADLGQGWSVEASFAWSSVDPRRSDAEGAPDSALWQARVADEIRTGGPRRPDTGGHGNGLSIELTRSSRALTTSIPRPSEDGLSTLLASVAGVERNSLFELSQGTRTVLRRAAGFDPLTRVVRWASTLVGDGFDPMRTVQVSTVEFDMSIYRDGILIEDFKGLAPLPEHSANIVARVNANSRYIALTLPAGADMARADQWPNLGMAHLGGGTDGLTDVDGTHWDRALAQIAALDDTSLIAAPDLALQASVPQAAAEDMFVPRDCGDLSVVQEGQITGLVVTKGDEPVANCIVDVAGRGGATVTDANGHFTILNLPLGLATLRFLKDGFSPLEILIQPDRFVPETPEKVELTPLDTPAALSRAEVLRLQRAMANPAIVGPYKVAVVSPNTARIAPDAMLSWAAELGPEPRLALFSPWVWVPDDTVDGGQRAMPPDAHICGLFARAEHREGIHRTAANLQFSYCKGVTETIDDAAQDLLNPVGVNALRAYAGRGIRANGGRTLQPNGAWRYVSSRRIVDAIEKSLERVLKRVVFEPNAPHLRYVLATMTRGFLETVHRKGILTGEPAFTVKCDDDNNPQDASDAGQLVLDVTVAPTNPAEFVVFRVGHTFDAVSVTEGP